MFHFFFPDIPYIARYVIFKGFFFNISFSSDTKNVKPTQVVPKGRLEIIP